MYHLLLYSSCIKIGDKECEYNPSFRLILHTKLANPHYQPELQAQCTLVNFTVTRDGLEDQLLAAVVSMERPDLEELKVRTGALNYFHLPARAHYYASRYYADGIICRFTSKSPLKIITAAFIKSAKTALRYELILLLLCLKELKNAANWRRAFFNLIGFICRVLSLG